MSTAQAELVERLMATAIEHQRLGGVAVEVTAMFNEEAARAWGLWGEGHLRLTLVPCGVGTDSTHQRAEP